MTGRKASNKLRNKFSHFSFESICVWHLEKNVSTIFKSKFGGQIWAAAKAGSQVKHDEAMLASYTVVNKNMRMQTTVLSPRSFRTFNQNRDNGRRHQMFQTGDHLFKVTSLTSGYTRMEDRTSAKKFVCGREVKLTTTIDMPVKDVGLLGHNVRTCSRRQPTSVLPVDLEEGNPRTIPAAAGYWKFKWRFRAKENSCSQCCVY
ncbi:hypothetical protein BASA62_007014 [Batrachochytrium salamandrivorans]|nr:hypothetical protein BASA62_007014 [Batrachochytrium salamandrivorans]